MSRSGSSEVKPREPDHSSIEFQFLLASIVESSKDAIISKTLDGIITSWNSAAEDMFGYTSQEIVGQSVTLITNKAWPNEMSEIMDKVKKGQHLDHYETSRIRKDGVAILVSLTVSPIRDSSGKIVGASSIARDVTAQNLASGYARSLIEASLDPLVTISVDGKIMDVNQSLVKITGVAREGLIGTDFFDYFTEPDKAREGYQRVFAEGEVIDYPLTVRHSDGKLTVVLYNASVYRDAGGHVLGVFAAARDVTAQKQAQIVLSEQQGRESERLKEMDRLEELERFQKLTIGRELKMIKLKKEIESLRKLVPDHEADPSD